MRRVIIILPTVVIAFMSALTGASWLVRWAREWDNRPAEPKLVSENFYFAGNTGSNACDLLLSEGLYAINSASGKCHGRPAWRRFAENREVVARFISSNGHIP